jgi:hypothetical protein
MNQITFNFLLICYGIPILGACLGAYYAPKIKLNRVVGGIIGLIIGIILLGILGGKGWEGMKWV